MKNLWVKGEVGNIEYYFLAQKNVIYNYFNKAELTKTIAEEMNDKDAWLSNNWGESVILGYRDSVIDQSAIELPPGVYTLKEGEPSLPQRLEVAHIRDDNYVPLQDQTTLISDIGKFLTAESLFKDLNFSYRRGYLLYGEPGTGKTAFIRNLVKQPIFKDARVIWANFIPSTDFIEALNLGNHLTVFIIEELLTEHGTLGYDMSELLQFLDGENSLQKCITIATTNYPQFMHKNLADRPSRFDVLFEMKPQTASVLKTVLERWLKRTIDDNELNLTSFSLAQLKEICLLHKFYDITLKEAADRLKKQSDKFKNNFQDKKAFGLRGDD